MTDSNDDDAAAPGSTTLQTTSGALTLGLADAQSLSRALKNFLEIDPSVALVPMLDADSPAWLRSGDTPFIDSRGTVRIGLWLLQARGDDIVLTWREAGGTPGEVGIQYVATVGRVAGSDWRIRGIAWERILPR